MTMSSVKRLPAATLAALVVFSALAQAQATPNLSGLWNLDAAKSAPGLGPSPMPAGGRGDGGVTLTANQILITQTPTELTIAQGTRAAVYKLDATENWSPSLKSMATWVNGTLSITWKREVYLGPKAGAGAFENQTGTDVYSLNGITLTIDKTITTPNGTQTGKVAYTKSS